MRALTPHWPPLALSLAVLAGCTVGPNYRAPQLEVQPRFAEPAPASAAAQPPDDWWTAFGDAELSRLIQIALAESPDIQTAASRVRQARLGIAAARAQLLPQVDAQGNMTYFKFSKNAGFSQLQNLFGGKPASTGSSSSSLGGIGTPGTSITTYAAGFDASWEIDVFGGTRRKIQSARATAEADDWNARDAELSLIAEIASQYFELRVSQAREDVIRAQIKSQARAVQLSAERSGVGLAPESNVEGARSQLANLQASLEPVAIDEHIQMHAIAVLVGRDPATLLDELAVERPFPATLPVIPPGLPSDLLRRRPDVRAAERKLAAATADIGVATADLYPKLNLTGVAELISTQLSTVISANSAQVQASPAISFPILDFGRIRTNIRGKREAAEQAWLAYQKTVLGALRDVEDALARIDGEQRHNQELRDSVEDTQRALAASSALFRVGLVDQNPPIAAQGTQLQAKLALVASDGLLRTDLVSLDKALGGGWQKLPDLPGQLAPQRPYFGNGK